MREEVGVPSRITINEIARRAGVSKGAVSYALNGRPGVSSTTRQRILEVARQLGWAPNRTARLLSGSRTDTLGLVLTRDARSLSSEPFYMEFVAGLEGVLSAHAYALLLQVTPTPEQELELYRRWASERRVDAVAVVDLLVADPRVAHLRKLDLPAVFVGDPAMTDRHTTVWVDDATAMDAAVTKLASLGHRRLGRVAGLHDRAHVAVRNQAFLAAATRLGLTGSVTYAEFSAEAARAAIRQLAGSESPPTAVLFDNDLMAAASLAELHELNIAVPEQMSVLAWDDSALCLITDPQLSAMSHDVTGLGSHVGRRLLGLLEGVAPASHLDSVPQFVGRGSTGPAEAGAARLSGESPGR